MTDRMIMSSNREITFMYRVGGIAVYEGHLLVEHNVKHDFCFVPGGRVEYGENAIEALTREVREELGEEVRVSRLVLVADNLFKLDNDRFHEVALYFLVEFAPGSKILDRDGIFEGNESGTKFQWVPLDEVEQVSLFPAFLRERVRGIPQTPEYVVASELESPSTDSLRSEVET